MQCHDRRDKAKVNKDTDSCMLHIYCTVYYTIILYQCQHAVRQAPLFIKQLADKVTKHDTILYLIASIVC